MIRPIPIFTGSLLVALLGGCGAGSDSDGGDGHSDGEARSLVAFDGCEALLSYAKPQIDAQLEWTYKFHGSTGQPGAGAGANQGVGPANPGTGEGGKGSSANAAGLGHSGTNLQEAGVEEPDLVKTDGKRIFSLTKWGKLLIVNQTGEKAILTDEFDLGHNGRHFGGSGMFLDGNRVLLLEQFYQPDSTPKRKGRMGTRVREIDVSTPGQARVLRVMRCPLEGSYVNARKIGTVVRVVLRRKHSDLDFKTPYHFLHLAQRTGAIDRGKSGQQFRSDGHPSETNPPRNWNAAVGMARKYNAELLTTLTERDLLPRYGLQDLATGQPHRSGVVHGCEQTMHPGRGAGAELLSVVTFDLARGLQLGRGTGVADAPGHA